MILALDISLKTGWARYHDGVIKFGTENFKEFAYDSAFLSKNFRKWLDRVISWNEIDTLIIERPFFRGAASWHLSGMAWDVHCVAFEHGVQRFEYAPTTIKKFITGSGKATKNQMMRAIYKMGYEIKTDHEADAVALILKHQNVLSLNETSQ